MLRVEAGKNLSNMNNYPKVVEQIHNEFNTAGEKLLQESLEIIEQCNQRDLRKGELLNSIGFVSSQQSGFFHKTIETAKEAQTMASIVETYRRQFPSNKFIRHEDVVIINNKYNLKLGCIEDYIGFVPEKNLNEIHAFKSKNSFSNKRYFIESIDIFQMALIYSRSKAKFKDYLKSINYCLIAASERHANTLLNELCSLFSSKKHDSKYIRIHGCSFVEKPVFSICAPAKDFKKQTLFQKVFSPVATKFHHVPDPVVLYPVEHGYIIVTAWGDEASDPLVANENMN